MNKIQRLFSRKLNLNDDLHKANFRKIRGWMNPEHTIFVGYDLPNRFKDAEKVFEHQTLMSGSLTDSYFSFPEQPSNSKGRQIVFSNHYYEKCRAIAESLAKVLEEDSEIDFKFEVHALHKSGLLILRAHYYTPAYDENLTVYFIMSPRYKE